ncbi:MAG TPA: PAS domain S-box protein [bacterium]|nr:PAS domain S-box protein [bacterium]HPN42483.1 PAS domain S-box protein [bacterium]
MKHLIDLLKENENWLIKRILYYAKLHDYSKYTSTLEEAWRLSIAGLTVSITEQMLKSSEIPEMAPDEDVTNDPLVFFGMIEAQNHKMRGITLPMFLGLFKYYRQSYLDLINEQLDDNLQHHLLYINRCFDRIELAYCGEWVKTDKQEYINDLQASNRLMANEKTMYLTAFESLSDPFFMLTEAGEITNLNYAATRILDSRQLPGSQYYAPVREKIKIEPYLDETIKVFIGVPLNRLLPSLTDTLAFLQQEGNQNSSRECSIELYGQQKWYDVKFAKMLDVSDKFTASLLTLRDITENKKILKALTDSEATLSSIFRAAPTGIGLTVDRVIKKVNERLCKMTGYTADELIGQSARILYPNREEFLRVGTVKYELIAKYGTGTVETQWICKTGEIRDILLSSTPINTNDLSQGVTFTALDITDRNNTLLALIDSEKRYRLIIENMSDYIYSLYIYPDNNVKAEWITGAFETITDYTFEDIEKLDNDLYTLIHPDDLKKIRELSSTLHSRKPLPFEYRIIKKNGEVCWLRDYMKPVWDENEQRVVRILGAVQNITERKQAEFALMDSEINLRSLINAMPMIAFITDNKGVILEINNTTLEKLGLTKEQCLGSSIFDIIPPDHSSRYLQLLAQINQIGQPIHFDTFGDKGYYHNSIVPIFGADDKLVRIAVLGYDLTELKKTEQALQISQKMLRTVLDTIPVRVFWKDQNLHYLGCNELFAKDAALASPEQVVGKKDDSLAWHENAKHFFSTDLQVLTSKQPKLDYEELRIIPGFSTPRICKTSKIPLKDPNGVIIGILGCYEDITEQKAAEEMLQLTQFSIDHAGDAVYWVGADARFVYVNETACHNLGYSRDELVSMTVHEIDPAFPPKVWKAHWQDVQKRHNFTIETSHKKKNNELIPVEITVNYINFHGREYNCAFAKDVSERKKAEKALRESEKRYRTLFETMAQGVVYQDDKGFITSANPAAERILGLTLEQMQGRTSMHPEWRSIKEDGRPVPGEEHPAMLALKTGEKIFNVVMGVYNPEIKNYRWININATPEFNDSGKKPVRVYATIEDITERKQKEEELRKYSRTQEVLLQEVNHRVKNNLAAIISMMHKEQDRELGQEKNLYRPILENLERRVNGLLTVHTLLSSNKWQPVNLGELCEIVIGNAIKGSSFNKTIQVNVEKTAETVDSTVAHHLTIVLNELATNSVKYALVDRNTAVITVEANRVDDFLHLLYMDDGPGFPEKILRGEFNKANIGFDIINGIITHSLEGNVELYNKKGAVVLIKIRNNNSPGRTQ